MSESRVWGRAWNRDLSWENVRVILNEVPKSVHMGREEVLELSSRPAQHLNKGQEMKRKPPERLRGAQHGNWQETTSWKPREGGESGHRVNNAAE